MLRLVVALPDIWAPSSSPPPSPPAFSLSSTHSQLLTLIPTSSANTSYSSSSSSSSSSIQPSLPFPCITLSLSSQLMEGGALGLLAGTGVGSGGSGSSGASNDENTVSKAEEVDTHQTDLSSEESSCAVETELELGLGLSLGSGVAGKAKHGAWGERGRILTAKDFPSAISQGGLSSSSRFSGRATASVGTVSGIKRTAESVSQDGGSPPAVSQVVGWPPIRAYRINSLVNQAKNQRAGEEKVQLSLKNGSKGVSEKIHDGKNTSATDTKKGPLGFVKVYMDGVLIGRKVDLNAHSCYETLALMLEDMFFKSGGSVQSTGLNGNHKEHAPKLSKLLNGSSEFVLTYEDKEGDWLLVGDVPWGMFLGSVKKLRIMRTSEAKGLAPRCQGRSERNGIKPI